MGWGIRINDIFIPRVKKNNLSDKIEDLKELELHYNNQLVALAASSPRTVVWDDEEIDWLEYVSLTVPKLLEELKEVQRELSLCEIAKSNLDNVEEE